MPAEKMTVYKVFETYKGEWLVAKVEATKTKSYYRISERVRAFGYGKQVRFDECFLTEQEAIDDWQRQIKQRLDAAQAAVAKLSKLVGVTSLPVDDDPRGLK